MVPFQTNRIYYIHLPFLGASTIKCFFWKGRLKSRSLLGPPTYLRDHSAAGFGVGDFKPSPTPRLFKRDLSVGGFLNILMILTPKPWGRWSNWTKPWGKPEFPSRFNPIHGRWSEQFLRFAYVSFMACVWSHQVVGEVCSQIFPEFVSLMPRLWPQRCHLSFRLKMAGWLGIFFPLMVSNMTWWFPVDGKKNNSIYIGVPDFLCIWYVYINQVWNCWEWPSPMKGVDQRHSSASEKWNGCGNGLRVLGVLWLVGSFRSSFSLFFLVCNFVVRNSLKIRYLEMWSQLSHEKKKLVWVVCGIIPSYIGIITNHL